MILTDYPWYYILLCLLAGAAYATVLYFVGNKSFSRFWRWMLAVLRFLAVSVIAFLLLAPMSRQDVDEHQQPHIVLAQDVSLSVAAGADSAFSLQQLLPDLEERYRVTYLPFGSEGSTDIGAVLNRYRGDDVAALVLASDGLHNRGANPTTAAQQLAFPVHCVALGDTTPRRDAWISNLRCNRIAMLDASFPVEFTVGATLLNGRNSRLTVTDAHGRQLFSQPVNYSDDDFSLSVSTTLQASDAGLQRYTLQVVPLDGESSVANNTVAFFVDVIDTRRKVALFANAPHPDLAAIKHAIDGNPNYETVIIMADDADKGKWKADSDDDYSLAILHNLPSRQHPSVSYADKLPQIFIVGLQTDLNRFNALRSGIDITAKVQRTNEVTALYRPEFTLFTLDADDAGALEALPPLSAPFGQARLAADVQTLFSARLGNIDSRQPLVAATAQGGQRRAWIWGEGLWRWRLADWQSHESHQHVDRLISQLVSFTAMQSTRNRLQVESERSYPQGEPVTLRAVLYNENYEAVNGADVKLTVNGVDYTFRRDAGGYSLTLPPLEEGLYRYTATADGQTAEGSFAIEALNLEMQRTAADHGLLATVASLTGGHTFAPSQVADLSDSLATIKPTIYTHTRYAEFLRLPLVLVLIILLLAAEWVLRKYHGEL